MERVKVALSISGRRRMLRAGQGFAYNIHQVRYTYLLEGPFADDQNFRVAVSTREQDQRDDAINVSVDVMAGDSGVMVPWGGFAEAPTDVGISFHVLSDALRLDPPMMVIRLAAIGAFSADHGPLSVEVFYDLLQPSKRDLAHLTLAAGGMARTPRTS